MRRKVAALRLPRCGDVPNSRPLSRLPNIFAMEKQLLRYCRNIEHGQPRDAEPAHGRALRERAVDGPGRSNRSTPADRAMSFALPSRVSVVVWPGMGEAFPRDRPFSDRKISPHSPESTTERPFAAPFHRRRAFPLPQGRRLQRPGQNNQQRNKT